MRESSREKLERRRRKGLKESLVFGGRSSLRYVNMIFEALVVFIMDFGYILGFYWDLILTLDLIKGEFGGTLNFKRPVL